MSNPGRPIVYGGKLKRHIITLIRRHGLSGARNILNANKGTLDAGRRNLNIVPKPLGICYPTLQRLARAEGLTFQRGRPKKAA